MRELFVVMLCLAACARKPDTSDAAPTGSGRTTNVSAAGGWLGIFVPYAGVRELCNQHITGNTMHIRWQSYASKDPPATVMAFYKEKHPDMMESSSDSEMKLRGPSDKLLSIYAVPGKFPTCDVAPAADEKTIIVASQAIR